MEATTAIDLRQTIDVVIATMGRLTITNDAEMLVAAEWVKRCKETQKLVKDHYEAERKATYDAYTIVTKTIKDTVTPLEKAEASVKSLLSAYQREQERKAETERRRLEAEARAKAEEKLIAQAQAENDEKILEQPIVVAPVQMPKPEKVEGVSYVTRWEYRITDQDLIPREYLMPDTQKIGKAVQTAKAETAIPGIEAYSTKTVRIG